MARYGKHVLSSYDEVEGLGAPKKKTKKKASKKASKKTSKRFDPKALGLVKATKKKCVYKTGAKKGKLKKGCVAGRGKFAGMVFRKKKARKAKKSA